MELLNPIAAIFGTVLSEGLTQSRGWQKKRTWTGLIMSRHYKRLSGNRKGQVRPGLGLRKVFDICGKFS